MVLEKKRKEDREIRPRNTKKGEQRVKQGEEQEEEEGELQQKCDASPYLSSGGGAPTSTSTPKGGQREEEGRAG